MKKKEKIRTRIVDNKVVKTQVVFVMSDEDGEVLRKADFPFPNGKQIKETVVLLDLDQVDDALF